MKPAEPIKTTHATCRGEAQRRRKRAAAIFNLHPSGGQELSIPKTCHILHSFTYRLHTLSSNYHTFFKTFTTFSKVSQSFQNILEKTRKKPIKRTNPQKNHKKRKFPKNIIPTLPISPLIYELPAMNYELKFEKQTQISPHTAVRRVPTHKVCCKNKPNFTLGGEQKPTTNCFSKNKPNLNKT